MGLIKFCQNIQSAENRRKSVTNSGYAYSRSDSDFEISNVSLKENKPDGVNPNSIDIDHYVRKNEGEILSFSTDCIHVSFGCGLILLYIWKKSPLLWSNLTF